MLSGRTSSAVIVRSWRISLPESGSFVAEDLAAVRGDERGRARRLPGVSEPVAPIITMSALPPYWVRFELRKKLVVGG